MSLPSDVRSAYERGRLRDALISAVPVLVLPILGIVLTRCAAGAVVLGIVLLVAFVAARWRGQSWAQGAAIGVLAGALAAAAPICLWLDGAGCVGPACPGWCAPVCGIAGVVAGIFVGLRARDLRALATGALVASVSAALGCWPLGLAMGAGAVAAIGVGALGGRMGRAALAR